MMLERNPDPGQGDDNETLLMLEAISRLCETVRLAARAIDKLLLMTKLLFIVAMTYVVLDVVVEHFLK